ncbi:melatonin receptor type 1B-like isoform X2 [Cylas formicarius]|uniref:melatonin receptor type 1B-like isoform X2 n=1 Tax=Cylas formicarius TaxID=197179 RepID=UPI00295845D0|nr:melatonin receptor type 1B-like isoform X2 [Cylas formicarius]
MPSEILAKRLQDSSRMQDLQDSSRMQDSSRSSTSERMISRNIVSSHFSIRESIRNTFIVNVALADLLVSGLVIPASAIVILAGLRDSLGVCRFQWFIAVWCFLVTVLSMAAVAWENYFRLCYSMDVYPKLTRTKITAILLSIWTICGCVSGMQFVSDFSFDYCTRKYLGLIPYQATVGVVLVFLPISIAFFCYIRAGYQVRRYKARSSFKAPITFNWDYALMQTNMYSLIIFLVFWLPFGVVLGVGNVRQVRNSVFYNLAWLAISKSCINSIFYGILNRHFRGAYVNLFQYCCCKTTVSFSRRQRPECFRPSGDVRVHIIPGYNMYCSPQRAQEGGRSKRSASARANGREVYEL